MSEIRRPFLGVLLALCASASFASRSIAPPSFDDELTQTHQVEEHMSMSMWMATEMFKQAVAQDMTPAASKKVLDALKGYAIFAIVDVRFDGAAGSVTPLDRGQMRASARLQLGDRAALPVLAVSELPPGVLAAVTVMKPMMANMLGKFGDSMEFVVFKDTDEHGNSLADPRGNLPMTLTFDKETFVWHLPLISMQPKRIDTATGDTFPGDYEFSPFTGHKLAVAK